MVAKYEETGRRTNTHLDRDKSIEHTEAQYDARLPL